MAACLSRTSDRSFVSSDVSVMTTSQSEIRLRTVALRLHLGVILACRLSCWHLARSGLWRPGAHFFREVGRYRHFYSSFPLRILSSHASKSAKRAPSTVRGTSTKGTPARSNKILAIVTRVRHRRAIWLNDRIRVACGIGGSGNGFCGMFPKCGTSRLEVRDMVHLELCHALSAWICRCWHARCWNPCQLERFQIESANGNPASVGVLGYHRWLKQNQSKTFSPFAQKVRSGCNLVSVNLP